MRIGHARPSSAFLGAREPVIQTDAGTFPAPRTVCFEHDFQHRLLGWSCRAPHQHDEEVSVVEVVYQRCAGLDVGKDEVVACTRVPAGAVGGGRRQEVRTYKTFSAGLAALGDWLGDQGVTQVVMEATGQYWKPVWYVLEERGFELLLVNARHVKILPGRKTDVGDAAWLCELLEHGLLRGSFVPPPAIRELRDLTRYRKRLIQARTAECQRIHKTLEDASTRLGPVASDVLGVSGRAMLRALLAGERDPATLADLARGRLRNKLPELREALRGRFGAHHALLLRLALEHVEQLERSIAALDAEVDRVITPFATARDHLDTITGVGGRAAAPAATSPAASAAPASPPRATAGSARSSSSAPGPPPTAATPTWPPSSGGWPDASARRRPPAPPATPSWWSPGACWTATATMPSLAATSSSSATPTAPANGQSPNSKPSATTSPSSRPPRNTLGFTFQDAAGPRSVGSVSGSVVDIFHVGVVLASEMEHESGWRCGPIGPPRRRSRWPRPVGSTFVRPGRSRSAGALTLPLPWRAARPGTGPWPPG